MKYREIIKLLERDGWFQDRQKGSHKQYKHNLKKGLVTISGKENQDIPIGILKSILKQSQIKIK
ncbi:MAG: type II toxin-antitoxin system HicA family toxin [Ignavibacteria bacterium]|jgi:predicted RNA binding protein YcfA (HicA-like mRNA interferase family)|nr:type II toxin-antitoxin system HicA family toxin [Ignavibacteria bacterium]